MKIGVLGLGRMGTAVVERLIAAHHTVIGFDPGVTHAFGDLFTQVDDIGTLAQQVRIFWLMLPSGHIIDGLLEQLIPYLQPGDIIIDGGNSNFNDSVRRALQLQQQEIFFLDCGTSGGVHGRQHGFSLMIGGDEIAFKKVEPIFKALAAPGGYALVGPSGAGHYVKMVHNGIEYALMQAYAEGFELLKKGSYSADLDLASVSDVWDHGSVIRSWLLTLLHEILKKDQQLRNVSGKVEATGMGAWTVKEAHDYGVPVKLIEDALAIRTESHVTGGTYATKLVALLRQQFGGHAVHHEHN